MPPTIPLNSALEKAAAKSITDAGRGLYGLVNNAGVLVLQPLIEIDEKDFNFQLDVNVYGPYRVTLIEMLDQALAAQSQ